MRAKKNRSLIRPSLRLIAIPIQPGTTAGCTGPQLEPPSTFARPVKILVETGSGQVTAADLSLGLLSVSMKDLYRSWLDRNRSLQTLP
jgi:hypothetical protein